MLTGAVEIRFPLPIEDRKIRYTGRWWWWRESYWVIKLAQESADLTRGGRERDRQTDRLRSIKSSLIITGESIIFV